jgi:hypothetical protein
MPTNSANEAHVEWWENYFRIEKPVPGKEFRQNQTWTYRLPDIEECKRNWSHAYVDVYDLGDVKPQPNYTFQMVKTPTWTHASRKKAIDLEKDYTSGIQELPPIKKGTFVVFKVQQPGWSETTSGQSGIDPDALTTQFGFGKSQQHFDSIDSTSVSAANQQVSVHVWYADSGGDPNLTWKPWINKPDTPGSKPRNWILEIPRSAILLSDVKTKTHGKYGVRLTAVSKKNIALHPDLDYGYLENEGLVSVERELEQRQAKVQQTRCGKSKKAIKIAKKARTKLHTSVKMQEILEAQRMRKRSAKSRAKSGSDDSVIEGTPYSEQSTDAYVSLQ